VAEFENLFADPETAWKELEASRKDNVTSLDTVCQEKGSA
jgi:hypothetical protein